ncbi:MAG: pentapeptide repeat-containing protein [Oscillatoria sp. PMC 1068.18]|nr:pentapeptide repeat-containing protein [Oscillatoria sp. PMC 1076.18]MEC4987699.1 pentapeptide repeat-containing protein [Oscillatoria sp. PMC 1068.18]
MKLKIVTTAALLTTIGFFPSPLLAENIQHTSQLLSSKSCPQCELSGAGLVMANLSGADLRGANLSRANLSRADLSGANLMGVDLSGASLNGANLAGAILIGANLHGTDLRDAYLMGANLIGTSLNTAYVQGTIGIPNYAGTPDNFHAWALLEAQRGNYRAAIENYNKALTIDNKYAPGYLGRAIARYRLGDKNGANIDAQVAAQLFEIQENPTGLQASQRFIQAMEIANNPPEANAGSQIERLIGGVGSLLLQLLF